MWTSSRFTGRARERPPGAEKCGQVRRQEPGQGVLETGKKERGWEHLSGPILAANPLSLCSQDSRSVLAVKGSLRRAARALDGSGPI